MRERPILFSAPMVRALLNCTKSQTRRVVKDKHIDAAPPACFFQWLRENCPYGQPGDRLWVRETFYLAKNGDPIYRACISESLAETIETIRQHYLEPWKPSIHMPRWASRILLEIVSVRVERLQDISEDDATAEGLSVINEDDANLYYSALARENQWPDGWHFEEPVGAYRELWESINGPGSWAANPWVWVVEFRRIEA